MKKAPSARAGGAFSLRAAIRWWRRYLQCPLLIVFSVQLATDWTSWAAPRTVLHAAMPRQALNSAAATNF
jgi:hypothetical protein